MTLTVGIPSSSRTRAAWTLHAVQDPQSLVPTKAKSALSFMLSTMRWIGGPLEGLLSTTGAAASATEPRDLAHHRLKQGAGVHLAVREDARPQALEALRSRCGLDGDDARVTGRVVDPSGGGGDRGHRAAPSLLVRPAAFGARLRSARTWRAPCRCLPFYTGAGAAHNTETYRGRVAALGDGATWA